MSFFPGNDPNIGDVFGCDAIELMVVPNARDIDGFQVRRAVPSTVATVTPEDDRTCLLEAGAATADAIAVHVAWIGRPFEVLEPPELADACRRLGGLLTAAADR